MSFHLLISKKKEEPSEKQRIKENSLFICSYSWSHQDTAHVTCVLSLPGCRQVWQRHPDTRPMAGTACRHCCNSLQTRRPSFGACTQFNWTLWIEWIFAVLTCAVFALVSGCRFDLQPAGGEAEGPSTLALTAVPGTQWNRGKDPTRHCAGERHLLSSEFSWFLLFGETELLNTNCQCIS